MKQKIFAVLVLAAMVTGGVFAQDFAPQSAASLSGGFSGFTGITPFAQSIDELPPEYQEQARADYERGMARGMAGLSNILFGMYSWKNGDIFGGALTAGLEGGGIVLAVLGISEWAKPKEGKKNNALMMGTFAGVGAIGIGGIFGFLRGMNQWTKLNATAWTGNPLDHINVAFLPDGEGISAGLTFKASY